MQGHYVLVLERLHGSLLDHIVSMAGAPARARVAALRKLAQQLLVGVGCRCSAAAASTGSSCARVAGGHHRTQQMHQPSSTQMACFATISRCYCSGQHSGSQQTAAGAG